MISLKSVKKSFGNVEVLQDITFAIPAGGRVSIIGPGGCGKSTILKLLLGLLSPDSGTITLLDTDMAAAPEAAKRKILRRVGMAFQQGALFDFMTVKENLMFAMENMTDIEPSAMEDKITTLLEGVKLARTGEMFPYELSGGMQRRVGIAQALASDPQVAIFDEPTSGLDPVTSTIILNMIDALGGKNQDSAQIIATSSVEIALRFAERIIVVNDGTVVADAPWRELILEGSDWVRNFLSIRLIGLDLDYARELDLPDAFIKEHWQT